MTYLSREQSVDSAQPIELYRFSLGTKQWLYTSGDAEVTFEGKKYQPLYIKRGAFTKTSDIRKSTIDIEVARDNAVSALFRTGWLSGAMLLTIYRHHYEDSDFVAIWKGRVTSCKWSGSTATLISDSIQTVFKRAGLRRVYQVGCPHVHFRQGCELDRADYLHAAEVTEANGAQLTITGASAKPANYFLGGMLEYNGEYQMIVAHSGGSITLLANIPGLVIGSEVSAWPGCDRTLTTCDGKYGNTINFGGLPFLPQKNPFEGGIA